MSGFAKLFSSIIHSTIWREDMHVKVVWITMLAMANRHGEVAASLPGLADAARVSLPQTEDAIARLSSPDPYSRTKANDGRRIEVCEGGWRILNYVKYREIRHDDERRMQVRDAVRRHRARNQDVSSNPNVSHGKPMQRQIAEAEAEADETHTSTAPVVTHPTQAPAAAGGERVKARKHLDPAVAEAFAAWYATYPRHEARADAERAWRSLAPALRADCERLTPAWVAARAGMERRYLPLPATYLRGARWTDDPPPKGGNGRAKATVPPQAEPLVVQWVREDLETAGGGGIGVAELVMGDDSRREALEALRSRGEIADAGRGRVRLAVLGGVRVAP